VEQRIEQHNANYYFAHHYSMTPAESPRPLTAALPQLWICLGVHVSNH